MSKTTIRVENVTKRYRLGEAGGIKYLALRDILTNKLTASLRKLGGRDTTVQTNGPQDFWALGGVSLEVQQGEIIGLIGRNGAGKTTLLKILTRITRPTSGRARIWGRVGSLLEVGTGFHNELTGRENVFLSGAILGMSKREILRKFDEIVAFAGVDKFIDTTVKHYSTGMYTRLAFAVAAHLEPEVLLVDEVLAVGDLEFQKKCLGKMEEVSEGGRTVVFVSHNMAAINRLCHRAILLENGRVKMDAPTAEATAAYVASAASTLGERRWPELSSAANKKVHLRAVRLLNPAGFPTGVIDIRMPCYVEIEYEVLQPLRSVRVACSLTSADGTVVFHTIDRPDGTWNGKGQDPGIYVSRCEIPGQFLNEGGYSISIGSDVPFVETLFVEDNVLAFTVEQTGGVNGGFPERWPGVICPSLPWQIETLSNKGRNTPSNAETFATTRKVADNSLLEDLPR